MGLLMLAAHKLVPMLVVFALWVPTLAPVELSAEIARNVRLVEGGQAAELMVRVRCQPGLSTLEAFVYVVQDGQQSALAGLPVTCTGRWARLQVRVAASPEAPFHAGAAQASAFLLLQDPATGQTYSASPTQAVRLRGTPEN